MCVAVNVVADSGSSYSSDNVSSNAVFTNCCFASTNNFTHPACSGNIAVANLAYMNYAGGDYRLWPWSPGVDAGITLSSWMSGATDLAGQPRVSANNLPDMGAYETSSGALTGYYVAQNGQTPVIPYTNWSVAASNIQDAVDMEDINYPATVWVGAGHYTAPPNARNYSGTNVVYIDKPLTLRSSNGVPASVSIDGSGTNRGIAIVYAAATSYPFVIDGFTISNCWAATNGGGIYFVPNIWTGVLQNCVISDNRAGVSGGGVYGFGGTKAFGCIVNNCTVRNNSADTGGGLFLTSYTDGILMLTNCLIESNSANGGIAGGMYYGRGTKNIIQNCIIRGNKTKVYANSTSGGGGIAFEVGSTLTIVNCLIYNNVSAGYGGGMGMMNASSSGLGELYNCTIVSNKSTYGGGGIYARDGNNYRYNLYNTIVYSNFTGATPENMVLNGTTLSYVTNSCTFPTNLGATVVIGSGVVTNWPAFVNFAGQDFHLKATSPCINTGTNQLWWMTGATDLDGQRRIDPISGIVDMGCYEYVTRGTMFIFR